MRLPRETCQIQQTIETHLPHLSQPQLNGLVLGSAGPSSPAAPARTPSPPPSLPLALAQMEQPAPVSPGVALRRQRPDKPLPNPTGRNSLLRSPASLGPRLVALRQTGPGHRPHSQERSDHRHRHQRPLPQLRHPRGLAHSPRHPTRLLDGPHRGTA